MYQLSYAEIIEDDQSAARHIERRALARAVDLLTTAAGARASSRDGVEALQFTRQLWTTFISELTAPDNALPDGLRANLISIGIWILKECEAIRLGRSANYAGIADICAIIRDGLR